MNHARRSLCRSGPLWIGLSILLFMCGSAAAHHSFAMFDQSRQLSLEGTVREFQWTNPHAFIHMVVENDKPNPGVWIVELNSPNNLKRQGWKSTALKVGDKVILVLNPLRDGTKGGLFISVRLPDGTVLGDPTRAGGGPINVPKGN